MTPAALTLWLAVAHTAALALLWAARRRARRAERDAAEWQRQARWLQAREGRRRKWAGEPNHARGRG